MSVAAALPRLSNLLADRFHAGKAEREAHGRSEAHFPLTPPDAVVYPESTEDVVEIVRICAAAACPVVGWGAGTSIEGHALAVRGGVVVDFSRMTRVLELRPEDMLVRVQPGLTRQALDEELRATGLFFPVDPGANASLGGMAATRASGTTAVRYGTMRDTVAGLQVVLADGRVLRTGSLARKSASGLDLTSLFLGSEGTLGLTTELTLRLFGRPEAVLAALCPFDHVAGAVDAVIEAVQTGLRPARIELMDAASIRAVNLRDGANWAETPTLMIELHGAPKGLAEEAERLRAITADHGGGALRTATAEGERRELWRMRHNAYWSILALRPGATAITTDVCVPISTLALAIEETRADIADSPLDGPILGHVGDGNFHAILLIDPQDAAERRIADRLAHRMAERALALGGTVTGEHGIGMGKLGYMAAEHGEGWDVMGQIKQALDPGGLFNPGKLYRAT